jgi:hypothetical protein
MTCHPVTFLPFKGHISSLNAGNSRHMRHTRLPPDLKDFIQMSE